MEGVQGYDDQVALVIPDSTGFGSRVLVTLGTPNINWIINMIKESEINELSLSLSGLKMAQLLACWQAELSIKKEATMHQTVDLADLKEVVKMTKKKEIDTFFFQNHTWLNEKHAPGKQIACNDSVHEGGDGLHLHHGLSVVTMYTEVISGSKQVAVVVKNLTAILITIANGVKDTQVMAVNEVPPMELAPRTLEELDEAQGIQWTRMLVERRKEVLIQQLDLAGLDRWSEISQASTHALLSDYHDIFSLQPGELGCTNLAKHEIRIVDDKPIKEWFQRIPPPMVDAV